MKPRRTPLDDTAPAHTAPARTNSHNRSLGAHGEQLAADYLSSIGYRVLDRNWRGGRRGEIDLIVRDGERVIAVEVKTRSGVGYGSPLEAITVRKTERLHSLLRDWVSEHRVHYGGLRVDAIGIVLQPGAQPIIDHVRGIS